MGEPRNDTAKRGPRAAEQRVATANIRASAAAAVRVLQRAPVLWVPVRAAGFGCTGNFTGNSVTLLVSWQLFLTARWRSKTDVCGKVEQFR
jgi:hypothetical protein